MSSMARSIQIVAVPSLPAARLRAVTPGHGQDELDLEFVLRGGVAAQPRPRLRLIRGGGSHSTPVPRRDPDLDCDDRDIDYFGDRVPTPTAALPEPTKWAARLAQAVIEVHAGLRPVHQLSRWTSHSLLTDLKRVAPVGQPRRAHRMQVSSIHVGQPADGVIEACAVATCPGRRSRAVALRLEGWDGRWICTSADVV